MNRSLQSLFLSFFYIGWLPRAPGTYGSLAAIPPALLVLHYLPEQALFFAGFLLGALAIKIIDAMEEAGEAHDPSWIVIDEVAGMWIALALSGTSTLQVVCSFLFFRALDIKKPSLIGWVDREVKGGLGVVGDDLLAGFFAGILSSIVYGVFLALQA